MFSVRKPSRLALLLCCVQQCVDLSTGLSVENAALTRARLREALSSFSGKLTLSPEIIIPEPTDPTAILLQSTAVQTLSDRIRTEAKANSAWLSGSVSSVQTFCTEQESARGNFPGPVPVIYCGNLGMLGDDDDEWCSEEDMKALSEAGISGILVTALDGKEMTSLDDLLGDSDMASRCAAALACELQPIPEVVLSSRDVATHDVEAVVQALESTIGSEPSSVLLTIRAPTEEENEESGENEKDAPVELPTITGDLKTRIPILGSVTARAGENRIGKETARFKEAGFSGAVLRSDCVPGFRMNPDLEVVGQFWSACLGDLKSTKSKKFFFRSKNNMEKDMITEWTKYSLDVVESGAIGDLSEDASADLDLERGDYKGF